MNLLVKYIFTNEISIQVHPSDNLARQTRLPSGQEESWIVIDAEPGATLSIRTKVPMSPADLPPTLDKSIDQLMDWKLVSRRNVFYIPAGTTHAIGAGVSIIVVQQNADVTYLNYDFGRSRELHFNEANAAA